MLEITRGRTWQVVHTIYANREGGPLADMRYLTTVKSQIREKTACRDEGGFFDNPLVVDVDVVMSGSKNSTMTLSLSRNITSLLPVGDYVIDVVGTDDDGNDESIIPPEAVKVMNRPSHPVDEDTLPDFSKIFLDGLQV